MESIIAIGILLLLCALALKYRYRLAGWMNLKHIPPEAVGEDQIDDQITELQRTIEDCQRDIRRLESKKEPTD